MTPLERAKLVLATTAAVVACLGWVLVCGKARAQEPDTSRLCILHPDGAWPDTEFRVSGIPVTGTTTWNVRPDGQVERCLDVPGLVRPYAFEVTTCNGLGCVEGVRLDGRPGPAFVWPVRACRYDANEDGAVGLDDSPPFLAAVWGVETCP